MWTWAAEPQLESGPEDGRQHLPTAVCFQEPETCRDQESADFEWRTRGLKDLMWGGQPAVGGPQILVGSLGQAQMAGSRFCHVPRPVGWGWWALLTQAQGALGEPPVSFQSPGKENKGFQSPEISEDGHEMEAGDPDSSPDTALWPQSSHL